MSVKVLKTIIVFFLFIYLIYLYIKKDKKRCMRRFWGTRHNLKFNKLFERRAKMF